ncbi:hypothetical protein NBRC111894_2618 [Sporolactobacillus inulinus]|uniref:Uncharacterized protein n=1 Tax=Sporolactobacillus inulinus TaxID=2078 RepID=A0A4Y1ZDJ7_9BACL|nr:hypothetical protein NBRC111894_2618 [Sporolactobacillus inulinus]
MTLILLFHLFHQMAKDRDNTFPFRIIASLFSTFHVVGQHDAIEI